LQDVLLVDVAFRGCSLSMPSPNGFPVAPSNHVDISGITFSSQAVRL
jgi:hypothetical protein